MPRVGFSLSVKETETAGEKCLANEIEGGRCETHPPPGCAAAGPAAPRRDLAPLRSRGAAAATGGQGFPGTEEGAEGALERAPGRVKRRFRSQTRTRSGEAGRALSRTGA